MSELPVFMFSGCENLKSVVLPKDLTVLPANVFDGCVSLKEIDLPDGLLEIHGGAFRNSGIESITLPAGLTKLGEGTLNYVGGAFEGCEKLGSILIPKSVIEIGIKCFYGCTGITEIEIGNSVEKIGKDAFVGCQQLTELVIPDSVVKFEFNSIAYTGIKHFVFPKNIKIPVINYYTPEYKDGITLDYLIIQSGTEALDYNWFYLYKSLKTFYFEGTEAEYSKIKKNMTPSERPVMPDQSDGENINAAMMIAEWSSNLTVYYYSEEEPEGEGNYWHYVDGVPTKW